MGYRELIFALYNLFLLGRRKNVKNENLLREIFKKSGKSFVKISQNIRLIY